MIFIILITNRVDIVYGIFVLNINYIIKNIIL